VGLGADRVAAVSAVVETKAAGEEATKVAAAVDIEAVAEEEETEGFNKPEIQATRCALLASSCATGIIRFSSYSSL
jgi:hypothetical protein